MSQRMSLLPIRFVALALGLAVISSNAGAADATSEARTIISESGKSSGFFVHLGSGSGELTSALRQNDSTQVHGLSRDPAEVQTARERIVGSSDSATPYGDVAFDLLDDEAVVLPDRLKGLLWHHIEQVGILDTQLGVPSGRANPEQVGHQRLQLGR